MENVIYLNDLELNKTGKVLDIQCDNNVKRRFFDLGIIKGTQITPLFRSPFF